MAAPSPPPRTGPAWRGLERIVSGGQTGVDRAALDVALALGVPAGGWCPRGRRAEDGPLAPRYPLRETPAASYAQRTEWNVRDSEGTLILKRGPLRGGTARTCRAAARLDRPCLVVDLGGAHVRQAAEAIRAWAGARGIRVLNVAGPRESQCPGIYAQAAALLREVLAGG